MSTIKILHPACTGCTDMASRIVQTTASATTNLSTEPAQRSGELGPHPAMDRTSCSVQARRVKNVIVRKAPMKMMGLRRPQRVRRRSLRVPMLGPTMAPERGKEIMIAAVADFERPRLWRYGWIYGQLDHIKLSAEMTACLGLEFNGPGKHVLIR